MEEHIPMEMKEKPIQQLQYRPTNNLSKQQNPCLRHQQHVSASSQGARGFPHPVQSLRGECSLKEVSINDPLAVYLAEYKYKNTWGSERRMEETWDSQQCLKNHTLVMRDSLLGEHQTRQVWRYRSGTERGLVGEIFTTVTRKFVSTWKTDLPWNQLHVIYA